MAEFEKKFGNRNQYKVTLDTEMEEGVTGCWIEYKTRTAVYSASLEWLLAYGELTSSNGGEHQVEQALIDDIEEWALENGY